MFALDFRRLFVASALVVSVTPPTFASTSTSTPARVALPRGDDGGAPIAPDGRAGFGLGRTARELEKLLRSPDERERAFLDGLRDLARDVELEIQTVHARYMELGWYDVLDVDLATPAALGVRFRELADDATRVLRAGGARSQLLARLLSDPRFRQRTNVIDGAASELADLRGALALLRAQTDGWVALTDAEAANIARRADLAAARLRAIRLDLIALRDDPAVQNGSGPLQVDHERLLMLAHTFEHVEIDTGPVLERLARTADAMSGPLFTTRLAIAYADEYGQRTSDLARAAERFARARDVDPDSPRADLAPKQARALGKTERRQRAAKHAAESLALDPLDDRAVWLAASSNEAAYGKLAALRWFDRYLALHGIREHDVRTWQGRALTREEERALQAVRENELLAR